MPDLRGYGDSAKPPAGENFINYSKRALALDQIEVMAALGHGRLAVAGHDRGARVTHRLLRDHPEKVTRDARHRADAVPFRDDRPEGSDRQLALVLFDPGPRIAVAHDRRRPGILPAPYVRHLAATHSASAYGRLV